jgi:hypothetical protein
MSTRSLIIWEKRNREDKGLILLTTISFDFSVLDVNQQNPIIDTQRSSKWKVTVAVIF